jgi:hypothetical protein
VFCFLKETVFWVSLNENVGGKQAFLTIPGQKTTVVNELKNLIKTD